MYSDFDTMKTMLELANSKATFSFRRTLFADGLVSLATAVGGVNRIAERIDDVLYPAVHEQPLGKPVYIVAAPRSGTTFLHRMMSRDEQFTAFKLYQTIFPTVTGQRVADRIKHVNGRIGALLGRVRSRIDQSSFGGWEGIHDTGLSQEEEDEALWALAFATPAIMLVLPFPERFEHLRFIDRLPAEKREKLVAYYRSCVQRHLYSHPGKTLLGKNVLLPGRFGIVSEAVPDARFVHVLRHPYEALPSMLSLFTIPWRWHSPHLPLDGKEAHALTELTIDYYKFLHQESLRSEAENDRRFFTVTYPELLRDPEARVREIYERFGLTLSPEFEVQLKADCAIQRNYKSEHQYSLEQFGLTRDYVYSRLPEIFEHYGFTR
jgi:hypothetical protein